MTDLSDVMKSVVSYLGLNGANVTTTFTEDEGNNHFARYDFDDQKYIIGVTDAAEQVLTHWNEADIEALLHRYRIIPGTKDLAEDEFLLVKTFEGVPKKDETFKDRGIIVVALQKSDYRIK